MVSCHSHRTITYGVTLTFRAMGASNSKIIVYECFTSFSSIYLKATAGLWDRMAVEKAKYDFLLFDLRDSELIKLELNFQQFIDSLSQRTNWANDSLQPKDQSIRSTKVKIKGKGTVILVDTPGFDESTRTAEDILEDVYRWLRRKQVCGKSSTQLKLKDITVTTTPKWQAFYISTTSLRIA